jgi:hypothetical protein
MKRATAVSLEEVAAARKADPSSVFPSTTSLLHEQLWIMDRGAGELPVAFRSGKVILVDVERLSTEQRAELGL